jgi:hypothetical protein
VSRGTSRLVTRSMVLFTLAVAGCARAPASDPVAAPAPPSTTTQPTTTAPGLCTTWRPDWRDVCPEGVAAPRQVGSSPSTTAPATAPSTTQPRATTAPTVPVCDRARQAWLDGYDKIKLASLERLGHHDMSDPVQMSEERLRVAKANLALAERLAARYPDCPGYDPPPATWIPYP